MKMFAGANQLKAGVILSYITMAANYVIGIVYTPIMLRLLGQSEYGLYNLVSSVVSYLGLLSFGFGSAYVRFYSRYRVEDREHDIAKLNGMFLIVFSVLGMIAVVTGMLLVANTSTIFGEKLTPLEQHTAKALMAIMVVNMAISFPASVFSSYITANEQYVFQKLMQLVKSLTSPFVTLPVLLMGYGSVGMVVATTLLNIAVEVSNACYCLGWLNMRFSFGNFDLALMKDMTVFSSYLFMNMIIDQVNWNIDKFILGRFRGTIEVAIYGLAAQINSYYLSLSTAISNVFIPRVHRMVAAEVNNGELTSLLARVGRIQFMLLSLVCSGFILFGDSFFLMWAGNDYRGSYPITLLLILPVTIPLVQNLGIEIQKAKNMHQFRSLVYLFVAIGNFLLSIPMAKRYGGVGSAWGTAIALLIGNGAVMNWYYHRRVGLDMKYFWGQIVKIVPSLIPPILVGLALGKSLNTDKIEWFLVAGLSYTTAFVVSLWFFGMNEYERELLGGPVRRILVSLGIRRGGPIGRKRH